MSRDGRSVGYSVRQLKHDCAAHLDPILILFASREEMKVFAIEVMITCNEAKKVSDRLIVSPQPGEEEEKRDRPRRVQGFSLPPEGHTG